MSDNEDLDFASGMSAFESKHFATAMRFLSPMAESGNTEAMHRVAIMYQNGLGVGHDPDAAVKWMRKAAEQGHAVAQHGFGFMFMEGDGVEKDMKEAIKWFTLAAEQGLAGSQTTLAMIYEEGNGVEKDPELAKEWYAKGLLINLYKIREFLITLDLTDLTL